NSATSTTTVNRRADLKVTKTAAPAPATAGTDETFTLKVENLGPSDSAGYTLTDVLPTGTSFVSASAGCANASGTVTCSAASLGAGSTDTYTVVAHISPSFTDGGTLSNTASLTAESTSDPAAGNNSSSTTTTVDTQADLSISKGAPTDATAGDAAGFDYTL